MPVAERTHKTANIVNSYRLDNGRQAEIRNGCVVDSATRRTLIGSSAAADWLLAHARLSPAEREWIDFHGRFVWPATARREVPGDSRGEGC